MSRSRMMVFLGLSAFLSLCCLFIFQSDWLSAQTNTSRAEVLKKLEWRRSLLNRKNFVLDEDFRTRAKLAYEAARNEKKPIILRDFLTPHFKSQSADQIEQMTSILLGTLPAIEGRFPSDEERDSLRTKLSVETWPHQGDRFLAAELWRDESLDDISVEQFAVLAALRIIEDIRKIVQDEESLPQIALQFVSSSAFVWSESSIVKKSAVLSRLLEYGFSPAEELNEQFAMKETFSAPVPLGEGIEAIEINYLSSALGAYDREKLVRYTDPQELDSRVLDSFEAVGFIILKKGTAKCSLPVFGEALSNEVAFIVGEPKKSVARPIAIKVAGDRELKVAFDEGALESCSWKVPVDELAIEGNWIDQKSYNYSLRQIEVGLMRDPLGSERIVGLVAQLAGIRRGIDYHCPLPEDKRWLLVGDSKTMKFLGGQANIQSLQDRLDFTWGAFAEAEFSGSNPHLSVALARSPDQKKMLKLTPRAKGFVLPKHEVFNWFAQELLTDPY